MRYWKRQYGGALALWVALPLAHALSNPISNAAREFVTKSDFWHIAVPETEVFGTRSRLATVGWSRPPLKLHNVHVRGKRHHKQNALLAKLLYCGSCSVLMISTYTSKGGQPHRYYICGGSRRQGAKTCGARPVSAVDLETALTRQLQPILGNQLSAPVIQQSLDRIVYDSQTRRVLTTMRDGTGFEFLLAVPHRGGVRRTDVESKSGRIPRISRVLALAIKIERLIREGVARNYSDAALLGHVSGCRMSQIMLLRELAPAIQEELLFLPKTLSGPDRFYERTLRKIAHVIDWEQQMEMFRLLIKTQGS